MSAALLAIALCTLRGPTVRAGAGLSSPSTPAPFRVPGIAPGTLELALRAYRRAREVKLVVRARLTVIDYSLASTERRLWVLDPERGTVLFAERVAHGRGSGDLVPERFGNVPDSHLSSLGVFRTAETYQGAHGYSLRIDGLDEGVNDKARERALVFHAADYATEAFGREHGRLGRSYGCPALAPAVARAVIDEIRGGSLVVAVGLDSRWVASSALAAPR